MKQLIPVAICALLSASAVAHHSTARYDLSREVSISGVVTRFDWRSPHVYIEVESLGTPGERELWTIEGGFPNLMSRNGWFAQSLVAGEGVIVTAHPLQSGDQHDVLGISVLKRSGAMLRIRESSLASALTTPQSSQAFVAEDIGGNWITVFDPGIMGRFLQPKTAWSLTEAGAAAVDAYNDSVNPAQDCILETAPYGMVWPSIKTIELGDDEIQIRFELYEDRVIHMDSASHDGAAYSHHGHSIGRWDGDELVVDTTHFEAHRNGLGGGLPSSREKHLVERFELSEDRTRMSYEFRVEDPVYLTEPMTGTIEQQFRPDLRPVDLDCDAGSARRYLGDR